VLSGVVLSCVCVCVCVCVCECVCNRVFSSPSTPVLHLELLL
jgi:hypothetical protein